MRPLLWASLIFLTACGGATSESPDDAVTGATVEGHWYLTMASMSGSCSGAAAGGQLHIVVDTAHPGASGAVNVIDQWGLTDSTIGFVVTGNVVLASGAVTLNLWKSVLSSGGLLTGTLETDGSFTGTLQDPKPGYSPIFVLGSCSFPTTGAVAP